MSDKPRVEVLPIEEGATPDPQNANRHTQRGGTLLANSLQKRGAFRSIASAGKGVKTPVTYAGNYTLEKAVEAGFTEIVNVHVTGNQLVNVVRDDVAPGTAEAIALGIEDNEIGKQSYSPDVDLVAQLAAGDSAILSALRREDRIFSDMVEGMGVKETKDAPPQIDRAAELQKLWKTEAGQLWKLGDHRLLVGDCTVRENVERLMGGERADMVITDPPYGMNLDTDYSGLTSDKSFGKGKKHDVVIGDNQAFDASLVIGCDCKEQIWFGADYYAKTLGDTERSGSWLVWDKRLTESADLMYGSCFELAWSKQKHKRDILRHKWAGFFTGGEKRDFTHPTTKPVSLISDVIKICGDGIIVYEPFAGSGTTIIAAQNLGRRCYAMEISTAYGAVILQRFADAFPTIEIKRIDK